MRSLFAGLLLCAGLMLTACGEDKGGSSPSLTYFQQVDSLARGAGCPVSENSRNLQAPVSNTQFLSESGTWVVSEVEFISFQKRSDNGQMGIEQLFIYAAENEDGDHRLVSGCKNGTPLETEVSIPYQFAAPAGIFSNLLSLAAGKVKVIRNEPKSLQSMLPKAGDPGEVLLFAPNNQTRIVRTSVVIDSPQGKSAFLLRQNFRKK